MPLITGLQDTPKKKWTELRENMAGTITLRDFSIHQYAIQRKWR